MTKQKKRRSKSCEDDAQMRKERERERKE